jgi:hypothetical protein
MFIVNGADDQDGNGTITPHIGDAKEIRQKELNE